MILKLKTRNSFFIILMIMTGMLLFTGCFTLQSKSINLKYEDPSFWFVMDPVVLTQQSEGKVPTTVTRVEGFDEVLLKCDILLSSINSGSAADYYNVEQIQYEVTMTIAMIDSLDPLMLFKGKQTIGLAQAAYDLLLSKRSELIVLINQ